MPPPGEPTDVAGADAPPLAHLTRPQSNAGRAVIVSSRPTFAAPFWNVLKEEGLLITEMLPAPAWELLPAIEDIDPRVMLIDWSGEVLQQAELVADLCRNVGVPLIAVVRNDNPHDMAMVLDYGADVVLPPAEATPIIFRARLQALLRRYRRERPTWEPDLIEPRRRPRRNGQEVVGEATPLVRTGRLTIDRVNHAVFLGHEHIPLSPKEYQLIDALADAIGRPVPIPVLARLLSTQDWNNPKWGVRMTVRAVRERLGEGAGTPRYITSARGVGYRLEVHPPDRFIRVSDLPVVSEPYRRRGGRRSQSSAERLDDI